MEKVITLLDKKQSHFNKISPDCSLSDAFGRMSSQNAEYLSVVDDNEKFLGILTEHDIARKTVYSNQSPDKINVKEVMNTKIPFANIDDSIHYCILLMKQYHTRYLPVFESFSFRGIISRDDILEEAMHSKKGIFDEKEEMDLHYSY